MKIFTSFFLILFSLSSYAANSYEALEAKLKNMASMRADFVERIEAKSKRDNGKEASGSMSLKRPGKFRWDVKEPESRLIVADGKYIWIYDAELMQVTKRAIDAENIGAPALFLSGSLSSIKEHFRVKKMEDDSMVIFKLTPRDEGDSFKWIKLYFRDEKLTKMQVANNFGQMNTIDFNNIKINEDMDKSLFEFEVKKDMDLIED